MQPVVEPRIEDVTAKDASWGGLADHERIYRGVAGYHVKVGVSRAPHDRGDGVLHFEVRGELLDDDRNAVPIAVRHVLTVHPETSVDVAAEVQAARELVVARAERAAIHHAAAAALEGVA